MKTILFSVVVVFCIGLFQCRGGDILWHIAVGEKIIAAKSLSPKDTFSHTYHGATVAPHAPLFQTGMALLHETLDWRGVVFVRAILLTLIFLLMVLLTHQLSVSVKGPQCAWLLAVFPLIIAQSDIHPQLYTYLFSILLVWLLFMDPGKTSWRAWFATLVILLWSQLHPSFPLGVLLIFLFGAIYLSWRWILAAVFPVVLLALVAPATLHNVWEHSESVEMLSNIKYWQPLFQALSSSNYDRAIGISVVAVSGLAGLLALVGLTREPRQSIYFGILTAVLCTMAVKHLRFYPLVLICLTPFVVARAEDFIMRLPRLFPWLIATGTTALLVTAHFYDWGLQLNTSLLPVREVEYLMKHRPSGRLFNSYNFGGYIMYESRGRLPVYIDPRSSQLYPDAFFKEFINAHRQHSLFENIVKRSQIGFTLLKKDSSVSKPLLDYLDGHSQWERVFTGPHGVVHRRRL